MSDYCCRPESKYTTHSGPGSAFGSPDRRAHRMKMIARLGEASGEYCGTPFRVATYTAIALQLAGTRNPGTRTLLQALSTDSSLDSPSIEERQTVPEVVATLPAPVAPFALAAPYHPHTGSAERCRMRHRRPDRIDDLPRAERCWRASVKSLRPEESLDPGESPCLPP